EKVENEIIKPKDKLINELYQENMILHKELSKQVNLVDKAIKYEKERKEIMHDNKELHNEVDKIKSEYEEKAFDLEWKYKSKIKKKKKTKKNEKERKEKMNDNKEMHNEVEKNKSEYEEKAFDLEWKYKSKIKSLEKENSHLNKIIDKFYEVIEKFIKWICKKFGIGESKELVRNFEKETNTFIDPEKQIKKEEREKE